MLYVFFFSISLLAHTILYDSLERFGIRSVRLDFIRTYLASTSQNVCYDAVKSSTRCQELVVIQGLKTCPLFFVKFSSDCSRMRSNDESIPYADNTVLMYVGTPFEELTDHANSRIRTILDWCKSNKLSLSHMKSEFMVVTNKGIKTRPQLLIGADRSDKRS